MSSESVEEILSPPCPRGTTTVDGLHALVVRLADWAEHYRLVVNRFLGQECVKPIRRPPAVEQHRLLSLKRLWNLGHAMVELRTRWDSLVRTFEDDWGAAREAVHHMTHSAQRLLERAYLSDEQLEAKQADDCTPFNFTLFGLGPFKPPGAGEEEGGASPAADD